MKQLFLFIGLMLSIATAHSQYVNGTHLSELKEQFLSVDTDYPWFNVQLRAKIDLGQEVRDTRRNRNVLSNAHGDVLRFNSEVHLFNYLYEFGYEFMQELLVNKEHRVYLFKKINLSEKNLHKP